MFSFIICFLFLGSLQSFQLNSVRNDRFYYLNHNLQFQKETFQKNSLLFAKPNNALYYRPVCPPYSHLSNLPDTSLGLDPVDQGVLSHVTASLLRKFPLIAKLIDRKWFQKAIIIANVIFLVMIIFPSYMKSVDEDFDESTSDVKILERQLKLQKEKQYIEELRQKPWNYRDLFRYFAFSSDIGEAIRPIVSPIIVQITYAMTLIYCVCDIVYEGYLHIQKSKILNQSKVPGNSNDHISENQPYDPASRSLWNVLLEKSIFHLFASILLPGIVIHNIVHYSHDWILSNFPMKPMWYRWGPSLLGLGIIPLLPVFLDFPIEEILEKVFHRFSSSSDRHFKHPALTTTSLDIDTAKQQTDLKS
jgi:fission process protein 1